MTTEQIVIAVVVSAVVSYFTFKAEFAFFHWLHSRKNRKEK